MCMLYVSVHNLMELQGVNEKDIPPLCIIGETGSGKSTLAALFAKTAIKVIVGLFS